VVHGYRRTHARRVALLRRVTSREGGVTTAPDPADLVAAEDPALARAFAELTATEREAIALVAWEAWTTSPPPAPPGAARARSPSGCPVPARA
jgi:DNA-directed RNA polymerase specialized sigma24 family protein